MGLEPTTFCMAIVCDGALSSEKVAVHLNPITVDQRGFSVVWSPSVPGEATQASK